MSLISFSSANNLTSSILPFPKKVLLSGCFKKDEAVIIPAKINYDCLSGLSNEIKSKLNKVRPKTLGQAIRIDGVTPAAIIIILSHIKKMKYKVSA